MSFVRIKDLAGQRFGKLVAVEMAGRKQRRVVWRCLCDCGQRIDVASPVLQLGKRTSCGCARRYSREQSAEVLWSKVDKNGPIPAHCPELGPCWAWGGITDAFGYGRMAFEGKVRGTHQVAWLLCRGETKGLCVLHHCDNPPCCNPDHLFLGTRGDNARDMAAKGRQHLQLDSSTICGDRHWARKRPELVTRGSRHGMSKLTESVVLEIREAYAAGALLKRLADRYGVGPTTLTPVVRARAPGTSPTCQRETQTMTEEKSQTPDAIELAFAQVEPPIDGREIGDAWWFRKGAEWQAARDAAAIDEMADKEAAPLAPSATARR